MMVMCVRIEEEDLLATAAIPTLLRASEIKELARDLLLCCKHYALL